MQLSYKKQTQHKFYYLLAEILRKSTLLHQGKQQNIRYSITMCFMWKKLPKTYRGWLKVEYRAITFLLASFICECKQSLHYVILHNNEMS